MYQYKEENIGENPINFYVNFTLPLLHKSLSFPFPFCISAHLLNTAFTYASFPMRASLLKREMTAKKTVRKAVVIVL